MTSQDEPDVSRVSKHPSQVERRASNEEALERKKLSKERAEQLREKGRNSAIAAITRKHSGLKMLRGISSIAGSVSVTKAVSTRLRRLRQQKLSSKRRCRVRDASERCRKQNGVRSAGCRLSELKKERKTNKARDDIF